MAQRPAGTAGDWTDAGLDPSLDYLFDCAVQPVPPPWMVVAPQHRAALETELRAEVADGHPLFAQGVIAVARCEGCDEVVFSVETDPVRFVSVHLTWRGVPEPPPWPWIEDLDLPLSRSLAEHGH